MVDQNPPPNDKKSIMQKFEDLLRNPKVSATKAMAWFRANVKVLLSSNDTAQSIMAKDKTLLRQASNMQQSRRYVGRMVMFYYQAKYRETLPYYDMFPLVIVVKMLPDGFLGLNLHYLPIKNRLQVLTAFYQFYKDHKIDWFNPNLPLDQHVNYQMLNRLAGSAARYYKPCVKRYLYKGNDHRAGGVKSRFLVVPPEEWEKMLVLPVERFVSQSGKRPNISASTVQSESIQKAK